MINMKKLTNEIEQILKHAGKLKMNFDSKSAIDFYTQTIMQAVKKAEHDAILETSKKAESGY